MRDYRNIKAWQQADDFAVSVYSITREFPKSEMYGLTSQLRQAGYSVAANICEGASRNSLKDYLHFFYIARGSCSEAQYGLHLAGRLGYLDQQALNALEIQAGEVGRTLAGLIRAVEKESGILRTTAACLTSLVVLSSIGHLSQLFHT